MISPLLLAAFVANAAPPAANPLEPALAGQVQCYEPNDEKKTCTSMASYKLLSGTRYTNTALVLVSDAGPVTLETTTPVEVKDGAVCGAIRQEDVLKGKVVVGGRAVSPEEAAALLKPLAKTMSSISGKEICTRYVPAAGGLIAKVSIEGVYRPGGDQRVKWVKATDGYSVAP